jgi:hypothetical protein
VEEDMVIIVVVAVADAEAEERAEEDMVAEEATEEAEEEEVEAAEVAVVDITQITLLTGMHYHEVLMLTRTWTLMITHGIIFHQVQGQKLSRSGVCVTSNAT